MRRLAVLLLAAALAGRPAAGQGLQDPGPAVTLETGPVLTLKDAIQLALDRNKNLKVVSYSRGISRAQLLTARGQFDPAIVANRSTQLEIGDATISPPPVFEFVREDQYGLFLQGLTPVGTTYSIGGSAYNERYNFSGYSNNFVSFGGINITQPLLKGFGFGANLEQVRIAKANRSISDWQYRGSAITTVTNTVLAYSNLQLAHDRLGVARRTRDLAASFLDDIEKEFRIGKTSQSDVIQARSQVASLEEPVIIYERQVRDAENSLRELIGEETFFEDKPLFVLAPVEIPDVTIDRRADLSRAYQLRPDYQEARLGIVSDRAVEAAAVNGLLPQVNFIGGYGYNGLGNSFAASRQMVYDRLNPSYSAGLQVTVPLTFSVGRGTLRTARLQRQQAEEDLKRLEADIAVAVATAEGQIETTRKRVAADKASYELAVQALEAEEKKDRAGISTTLAVVQEQQALSAAGGTVAGALALQRQAVANYDMQLGTTLERYGIRLSDP